MPRKLDLGRFIRKSRVEGGLLPRVGAFVPGAVSDPALDAENLVSFIEAHLHDGATLTEREYALAILDTVEKATRNKPEVLEPRVRAIQDKLADIDRAQFEGLQGRLRSGDYGPADLRRDIETLGPEADAFALRLFDLRTEPPAENAREENMVHYKASSLAVALELVGELQNDDVLYDLGSGLGVIPIWVAWLSGVRTKGVEFEPAYCRRAVEVVERFGIEGVTTIQSDARAVDYSDGTAFYFFDPFREEILAAVLDAIRSSFAGRNPAFSPRFFARGRTTDVFDALVWLKRVRRFPSQMVQYEVSDHPPPA